MDNQSDSSFVYKVIRSYFAPILIALVFMFIIVSVILNVTMARSIGIKIEKFYEENERIKNILEHVDDKNVDLLRENDTLNSELKNKNEKISDLQVEIVFLKEHVIQLIKKNNASVSLSVDKERIIEKPMAERVPVKSAEPSVSKVVKSKPKRKSNLNLFKWFFKNSEMKNERE